MATHILARPPAGEGEEEPDGRLTRCCGNRFVTVLAELERAIQSKDQARVVAVEVEFPCAVDEVSGGARVRHIVANAAARRQDRRRQTDDSGELAESAKDRSRFDPPEGWGDGYLASIRSG